MVTETKIGFALNSGAQDGFVKSLEAFPLFSGGSGSGKTAGGCLRAGLYNIEYPGARGLITEPIYAHFQDILLPAWRSIWGSLEGITWEEQGKGGPNHQIVFKNGSLILLKAAEAAERLIGMELAWAWMDEAASTKGGDQEMAYFNLVGRLRQKGFWHWLGVTTTPGGRNWLWREWVDAPQPGHVIFHGSTYENEENLPKDYIERMAQTYVVGTPMYRQYVLGEFVQMEGLVLPGFDPDTMIAPWPKELFLRRIAGVDFGVQSATTVIETSITQSRRKWVKEWLYKRECDDETFVRACRAAMDDGVTLFVCDPSGKDKIRWMNDQGIPARKARSNRIEDRANAWRTPIGQGMLTVDNGSPFTVREIMGLAYAAPKGRELETDRFDPNTPDHAFDGGAYGLEELENMILDWKPPETGGW